MTEPNPVAATQQHPPHWAQKVFAVMYIIFAMELGLFLAIYPWSDRWQMNLVPAVISPVRWLWLNGYFRGAVSGLGLLNIWIAFCEVFRLKRFSSR